MSANRIFAALIALAVLATFVVRVQLSMEADGHSALDALWKIFRFFTIWSNALVGLALLLVALGRRVSASVLTCLMMAMILVSSVYYGVLYEAGKNVGLDALVDTMYHAVIPSLVLVYWLGFVDKGSLRFVDTPLWQAYPLVYCVYALGRGLLDGVYPYGFLNPDRIGWLLVGRNIVLLAVAFILCGLVLVAIGRALARVIPARTA